MITHSLQRHIDRSGVLDGGLRTGSRLSHFADRIGSSDFKSAQSTEFALRASTDSDGASHTFSDLTQSSVRSSKDSESLESLASRQVRFENEVIDSLNVLTDRINAIEMLVGDRAADSQRRLDAMQTGVKTAFSALVERIIGFIKTVPVPEPKRRIIGRAGPMQSRTGMRRTHTTPVRAYMTPYRE